MIKINLFIGERDIKALGFVYELNIHKCKDYHTPLKYNTFKVNDGIFVNYPPIFENTQSLGVVVSKDTFMENAAKFSPYDYVNSIYVELPEPKDVVLEGMPTHYHGHPTVIVFGHTRGNGRYGNWRKNI